MFAYAEEQCQCDTLDTKFNFTNSIDLQEGNNPKLKPDYQPDIGLKSLVLA